MRLLKKMFGGINLSWPKLLIFAVVSGVYTALVSIIPQLKDTSLHTIAVTFEVWILFGIFIIMNSKSNLDAALKSFVFFLISQPLVYLLQVPFSWQGWGLFQYYPKWFIWTVLCLPMGFIGYYIKKGKWWGYLILLPMVVFTASSYQTYAHYFTFCRPYYLLITIFCAVVMLLYPIALFDNKKIRIVGVVISALLIAGLTIAVAVNPMRYSTDLMSTFDGEDITAGYSAELADDKYGKVSVAYNEYAEAYEVHADFERSGRTELIVTAPDGRIKRYDLVIGMMTYEMTEK